MNAGNSLHKTGSSQCLKNTVELSETNRRGSGGGGVAGGGGGGGGAGQTMKSQSFESCPLEHLPEFRCINCLKHLDRIWFLRTAK